MYSIGVDIGGTGIKAGIVDCKGKIIYRDQCKTDVEGGFDKIISDINIMVRKLISDNHIDKNEIKSIGFGVPSFINKQGKVTCVNLKWHEVEFVSKLKEVFSEFNVFAENDATVAALAENKYGSMNNSNISVLITLGTGVGGGIIINGKPFVGAHGMGSEIGHVVIGENIYDCNCGNNGCFETFCSATALIKYTQIILKDYDKNSIIRDMCENDLSKIDAKMIFDAYRQEDYLAKEVIIRFKKYLAIGIAGIVNTIDPDIIAIGGGLSKSSDIILQDLKEMVRNHILYKNEDFADIVVATLGNDAGIIGASLLN
ncbi:ROK family protein [Intestinibacter sp.]|uniref:ROK family protein n=1 Tax=Intestinibacter sp. TaxID=1965304 RepID=UPI003F140827